MITHGRSTATKTGVIIDQYRSLFFQFETGGFYLKDALFKQVRFYSINREVDNQQVEAIRHLISVYN
jgi:hypothetical protein